MYWSKTRKYGLQTWSKRGVILEEYTFGTSYTFIKRLLWQLVAPTLAWVGCRKTMLGPPVSATSRLVATARLLRTTLSLSTPVDTSLAPSPPVSSSVPTMQKRIMNIRRKHYCDNLARAILTLSNSRQQNSPESFRGETSPEVAPPTSNFKLTARNRLLSTAMDWLAGRFSGRIVH